ncbi:hypothetical protein G9A89_009446 [Geosiphon pyriformis]|nr:hypothetical protein G9A89_009446 [Geosiphon pyriformis]
MVAPISITSSAVSKVASRNVLDLIDFVTICDCLLGVDTNSISVYTNSSLAGLGTVGMWAGAVIFFDGVDLGLGVEVSGLVSSTMMELQAIALALECVPPSSSVYLFSDIKGHSGVVGNECADALAMAAAMSKYSLPLRVNVCYILAGAQWEIGSGSRVLVTSLHGNVDWRRSSLMWHPNMHMAAGSTEKCGLIPRNGSVPGLVHGLSSLFSAEMIKMLGIAEAFGISFGFRVSCLFFSGIGNFVLVIIDA